MGFFELFFFEPVRRKSSFYADVRINRNHSSEGEMAGSCGSRVSVIGNRIQLFAEDDQQGGGGNGAGGAGGGGRIIEEAQDLLSYRKTDSARLKDRIESRRGSLNESFCIY